MLIIIIFIISPVPRSTSGTEDEARPPLPLVERGGLARISFLYYISLYSPTQRVGPYNTS